MNIYVGNLPKSITEEIVRDLFKEYGEVSEVKLIKDQYSGELRGFGFVEMPAKADAQKAIAEIDETEIDGRKIIVNEARPRKDRPGGGGRRGPGGMGSGGGRRGGGNSGGGGGRGPRSRSW